MSEGYIQSFKLKVHESNGIEYENLFSKVMSYYRPGFDKVKPHGNIGDRGNDGWVYGAGIYYQVYAPEDLPNNEKKSLEKMKDDFKKLYSYWNTISTVREFYYVVNDKYNGIPPYLNNAIAEIKNEYNLNEAMVIGATILESFFATLSNEQKNYICGQSTRNQFLTESYLVECLTNKMYLHAWNSISDNLIANAMESIVVDGFYEACQTVLTTQMPSRLPNLDLSMIELANHAYCLCEHITDTNFTSHINGFWKRDMSWKRIRIDQDKYDEKYNSYEHWRRELFRLHYNLAHALNLFSLEVRNSLDSDFFLCSKFGINDSIGTYNNMEPMYYIPSSYCSDYHELFGSN
ncbi:hypothetical protein [Proteus mirabilis]|uniref:hypothetical protein n=1 Tax=Proteus mirabilis TaxID=584 RepID=UPI000CE05E35|nr:hypothetical protein [Proteus mirabilis]AVB30181.1 hypothetical protein C3940_08390 [Proteus mirabilis]MCU9570628.1 hypothetical protein [Proteus mirabilis]QES77392.1 hypothetical protein F3Y08_06110 [Proteus mirabilis]QTR58802.1 hypothetical protein J8N15_08445 [Proteus mirabilis]HAT5581312.1 hypothetical protein [Proteus mirabilis]